jgi:diguanylate cyclase (GGDEF)-like protein/PAS domain S-box-containing protein
MCPRRTTTSSAATGTLVEQLPLVVYIDALDAASSNLFTSTQIEPLLGYTVEDWEADATLFVRTLHPEDRDRVLTAHARTHATHEPLSVEYRLIASDGRVVWVRDEGVVVVDEAGKPLYLQGYLLDVTAEREAQAQLRQMALYDPLTGLANRAFFHEQLQHATALRKNGGEQTALLFVDLNHFKEVNDRFGHDVGDAVLARLGRRIQNTVRAGDGAARLGGDEFAIVLAAVAEPAEAARAAERLLQRIIEPIGLGPAFVSVTASIGIALGDEPELLLKEADAAMYRAKSQREAGFAFFDSVLDRSAVERSRRAAELRRAGDSGEVPLDLQPVVDLDSRTISGYEALLRWQHPEHGQVGPLDFIPLAGEMGLIVPLGKWVLAEACRRGTSLHAELGREVRMSVNVSARQLQHPDFVGHVEQALESSGFPPACLTLELTETVLLSSGDSVEQQLTTLKAMGISFALDDFGTGYASLAYLRRLPVDIVKIDRSFPAAIGDRPRFRHRNASISGTRSA